MIEDQKKFMFVPPEKARALGLHQPDVTSVHFDESELSDYQRTLLAGLLFGHAEEQVVFESGRRGGRTFMGNILEEVERQQRADLNAAIDAAMPHRQVQQPCLPHVIPRDQTYTVPLPDVTTKAHLMTYSMTWDDIARQGNSTLDTSAGRQK